MLQSHDPEAEGRRTRLQDGGPRIAVVFFGITRSLRLTLGSINRNVIAPARAAASDLRTVGHFFDQSAIDNPSSNEAGALDPDEFRLLDLDEVVRELPGACLEKHGFDRLKGAGDSWKDDFASLRNLVHQLHSLACATDLALAWKPDIVVFARPDLCYHDSMAPQLAALSLSQGPGVLLPDWAQWRGCNDRFALARGEDAISAYGHRVTRLNDYVAGDRPVHSEQFLKFALGQVPVGSFGLRASRVRSNGMMEVEDFSPGRGWGFIGGQKPFSRFLQNLANEDDTASRVGK
jgi:hypothetical protein